MDIGEGLKLLWDAIIVFIETLGDLWTWMTTPLYLGLKIDLLGINWGWNIVPLTALLGGFLITFITFTIIKKVVPVA